MNQSDRFRGCLLGLAVGDAVGTAVEFRPRGSFPPLTDMVGGGAFGLLPGQWTDDTSMALCLATRLVECGGFDVDDQMRRYCRWMDEGYLSNAGVCFDIGTTVASALRGEPRDSILFADAEAVLMAANLGDDADTTAAVCGQVAGAYYGEQGIPSRWLEPLVLRKEIARLADALPAGGG